MKLNNDTLPGGGSVDGVKFSGMNENHVSGIKLVTGIAYGNTRCPCEHQNDFHFQMTVKRIVIAVFALKQTEGFFLCVWLFCHMQSPFYLRLLSSQRDVAEPSEISVIASVSMMGGSIHSDVCSGEAFIYS